MANTHDPRLTPARDDLAAGFLRGSVAAKQFVDGKPMECAAAVAPILKSPSTQAMRETELLLGEPFTVFEEKSGWAWGQSGLDGYVGYVPAGALCPVIGEKTLRVTALRTFVFSAAHIKSTPYAMVSMNSIFTLSQNANADAAFTAVVMPGGDIGYIVNDHCNAIHQTSTDYVCEAEKFLHAPYLWGGRSSLGLDCSALVQHALSRSLAIKTGDEPVLRDTDMQEKSCGTFVSKTLDGELHRGDLIFWKGHVGIMMDSQYMIHANGTYMMVSINDVHAFAQQVAQSSGSVTSVKRFPHYSSIHSA